MFSRKNKLLLLKVLSLFSVVRGYNILIIVLAQYLASILYFGTRFTLAKSGLRYQPFCHRGRFRPCHRQWLHNQ